VVYTKKVDGPKNGEQSRRNITKRRILSSDDRTLRQLRNMGEIQCTTREVAMCLAVSEPTLMKFLNEFPEARAAYDSAKGGGKVSLRRTQFNMAKRSAAMAIWLGKNWLGQSDGRDAKQANAEELAAQIRALIRATDATIGGPLAPLPPN
jgi:hypothetical protein